jgi:hypothetical protein
MNWYIRYEYAGDEYVGRSLCGKDRLGERFAESPPYWDFSGVDEDEKDRCTRVIDSWIKDRMPGGENVNMDVFKLFKMCLASFIFNRPWLEENMHPENAVRSPPFWSESIPYADNVVTLFPWNKTRD